ncbi:hypothetical protein IID10_17645 [candidate division KSB1 bacterium]|nr:hypothetical protein [candidate division KSB1 bacterium]
MVTEKGNEEIILNSAFHLAVYAMSSNLAVAQVTIDSFFPFQTEPMKKYSLHIPATYVEGAPSLGKLQDMA